MLSRDLVAPSFVPLDRSSPMQTTTWDARPGAVLVLALPGTAGLPVDDEGTGDTLEQRLSDEPFALLGVNSDGEPEEVLPRLRAENIN
jgi:hypothetical protein